MSVGTAFFWVAFVIILYLISIVNCFEHNLVDRQDKDFTR